MAWTPPAMATTPQLTMLFSSLTVSGLGITGVVWGLTWLISVWVAVFLLSVFCVWFFLENLVLFSDLQAIKAPSDSSGHVRRMQADTISDLVISAKALRERNEQLVATQGRITKAAEALLKRNDELVTTQGIIEKEVQTKQSLTLSLLHWTLLFRKVIVMHYIHQWRAPVTLPRASRSLDDIQGWPRRHSMSLSSLPL